MGWYGTTGKKSKREIKSLIDKWARDHWEEVCGVMELANYKLLFKNDILEVRKYPPCRRTIFREDGDGITPFFIPLPYQVYFVRETIYGRELYLGFAKEDDKLIYPDPWNSTLIPVCIDTNHHVYLPETMSFEEIVGKFWATTFFEAGYEFSLMQRLQVRDFADWATKSPQEIVNNLRYAERKVSQIIRSLLRNTPK
jgi:hypothetical protein